MVFSALSPRRPSLLLRHLVLASALVFVGYLLLRPGQLRLADTVAQLHQKHRTHYHSSAQMQQTPVAAGASRQPSLPSVDSGPQENSEAQGAAPPTASQHPIDHLIRNAEQELRDALAKETHSLSEAADAYRKRRGRHPPPGFDKWYQFAAERNTVVVEDFWDQIYHDLNPFWARPAQQIQRDARRFEMKISVRSGQAATSSTWFWTTIWLDMVQTVAHLLPDMDIALNAMDEPRLVVPWEAMRKLVAEAEQAKGMPKPGSVVSGFHPLDPPASDDGPAGTEWETTGPYWDIVRRGCAGSSPARQALAASNPSGGPLRVSDEFAGPHTLGGFVANSSLSRDICHQPDLQGLNGIFIEPLSISSTASLLPLFGGSKLSVNNDILLPAPMYWSDEARFASGDEPGVEWAGKKDAAIWRGVATGGRNRASNWRGFHRHRFVALNNGTALAATGQPGAPPLSKLAAQREGRLGAWVAQWSNCSFVDLMCSETGAGDSGGGTRCAYTGPFFSTSNSVPLPEQFLNKYLPDIDGNSFSGRYLAFLRSSSLPIKATLWREWHDARLVAWKHYVPMDSRFGDWLGIMEYFLGYNSTGETRPGHDEAARRIASEGRAWAERVLRKADMQVYVLRLLLEYARVSDEQRAQMGWVGDLTA